MLRQALDALSPAGGDTHGEPHAPLDLRLEASFEQAPIGMAHVGLDGRWLRVNDQCCAITGYGRQELLEGRYEHFTHAEDLPQDLAQVERLLSGEAERYAMDKRYNRKGGGSVWVNLTVTLIRDADGAPDFFVVVIQDISDRKHVESNLIDSEARYRAIFDSAVEAIAVIDSRGTMQSINPAVQRIFGYAPSELIGKNVRTLMPQRIAREHDGYLDRYRVTHKRAIIGVGREVEGMRKDGTPLAIDLSVAEWERGGQTFFTGIMRDITPRREAEAALRASEERLRSLQNEYAHLARVNEMGEMAAAIAHEINQPLTAIVNNLNAGLYAGEAGLTQDAFDEAQEVMVLASEQALRAGDIVHRLREFVGKSTGERRVEAIDALVDAASELALIDAAASGIRVERVAGAAGVKVRVDAVQIQQVIVNLLRNASDALIAGPPELARQITIATSVVPGSGTVEIRIADNGPGIPEELRSTVFEPFFTSKAKGMGMGLSVCRRLIEAHGGSIELEAAGSSGAAFLLQLPQNGPFG